MTERELLSLVQQGESEQLEFKQSSAQFPRAGETLCAFMNGRGGRVLVGVGPDGLVAGQTIADKTFQDLARVLRRFDPPITVESERIPVSTSDLEILVLKVEPAADSLPCTYDGRALSARRDHHIGDATGNLPANSP